MASRNPLSYCFNFSRPVELFRHVSLAKNHASGRFSSTTLSVTRRPTVVARAPFSSPNPRLWNRTFSSGRRLLISRPASRPAVQSRGRQTTHALPRQRVCRRYKSTRPDDSSSSSEHASLSQRLRKLSREYGWSALGVYLLLSALDFPFCFAAVRHFGADKIGHLEHVIVGSIKDALRALWPGSRTEVGDHDMNVDNESEQRIGKDEKEHNTEQASIWAQLALAYAIHKSFIFIRVPLTAAVTPKVVKVLRSWGWNIGKRKPKNT